jgi:hypothetical protein
MGRLYAENQLDRPSIASRYRELIYDQGKEGNASKKTP